MAFVLRAALLAVMALTPLAGTARAGGGTFDNFNGADPDDPRGTVFGFVKDKGGDPVDNAKVTVTMTKLNSDIVVQSDPQGHFIAKLFYKPTDPADLALACAKDGYHQMAVIRRPPLAAGAPIEIDCSLQHD
jgi:hypothetical protein